MITEILIGLAIKRALIGQKVTCVRKHQMNWCRKGLLYVTIRKFWPMSQEKSPNRHIHTTECVGEGGRYICALTGIQDQVHVD